MSSTTEELHSEIYPRIFANLPKALPEFGFQPAAKGYQSTTNLKITGEVGDKVGGIYVYENNIYHLIDVTRSHVTIWDYVKQRDGLTQEDTFKRLAEMADYALQSDSLSPEAMERLAAANRKAKLWEDVNKFFINCLSHKENSFSNSPGAVFVQNYLIKTRGYSPSIFLLPGQEQSRDLPKMEVGYIPSIRDLQLHLVHEAGYSADDVKDLITDQRIGDSHRLSIPYRDPSGRIRGMVFRDVTGHADAKYLYTSGLERKQILFNLKGLIGDRDLIIVEGVLDALHASAAGLPNVVAIGGSGGSLSKDHIEAAVKYGAKRVTLLLDNDKAGVVGTAKALKLIQQYPVLKPYVAYIDAQHKDLDRLLTIEGGLEQAKRIITNADDGWRYQLKQLFSKYNELDGERGEDGLSDKDIDDFLAEVVEQASELSPLENDQYTKYFLDSDYIKSLGITKDSLEAVSNDIRSIKRRQERAKLTRDVLSKATTKLDQGQGDEAVDYLRDEAKKIKDSHKEDELVVFRQTTSESELQQRIKGRPEPLDMGYDIGHGKDRGPIMIPAGQITFFAAPTSHGKSVLIANTALNLAERYDDKTFHIFSYEVDQDTYLINLMNTYINDPGLAANNRASIEAYYRGETQVKWRDNSIHDLWHSKKKDCFLNGRKRFFENIVDKGLIKVHYVDYDLDKLIDAILYVQKHEPLGAVLIDYMQLIDLPIGVYRTKSRQEEVKQICRSLNALANNSGLPLILAAQFNRTVTNLARIHATAIGEAGDIERVGNLILGIWNHQFPPFGASKEELKVIEDKGQGGEGPGSWYVQVLKRRGATPGEFTNWNYDGNTGKVTC